MATKSTTGKDVTKGANTTAPETTETTVKRKPGRPFGTLRYDNLDDLQNGIDAYFEDCDNKGKPYTMEGLGLYLNVDAKTISNYGRMDSYFPAIHRARQKVLDYASTRLYDKDGNNGAKFYLTNNAERMGGLRYADRQETALDIAPITFVDDL